MCDGKEKEHAVNRATSVLSYQSACVCVGAGAGGSESCGSRCVFEGGRVGEVVEFVSV